MKEINIPYSERKPEPGMTVLGINPNKPRIYKFYNWDDACIERFEKNELTHWMVSVDFEPKDLDERKDNWRTRYILFKAKSDGEWKMGYIISPIEMSVFDPFKFHIDKFEARKNVPIDPNTICEYTGLEINWNRLFENDKFVYKSESSEFESYVVFRVGAFGFIDGDKFVSFASMGLLLEDFLNHITITGNIHDTD